MGKVKRCEWCGKKAFGEILDVWFCKRHYIEVADELNLLRLNFVKVTREKGRYGSVKFSRIFKFLEQCNGYVKTSEMAEALNISFPTALNYLKYLQKWGFVEKVKNGTWKVRRKEL